MRNFKENLRLDAESLRKQYINKPFPKGNVTVIELHLKDGTAFGIGAISKKKSPVDIPKAKSERKFING
ncbi:hypothetical protein [Gloeothece verrucosa]|uniref:Uncharacterized protein n=1 Tax=Gloeothece verrucosa (strain PCC 7822) TaxID=497965 RepID=E0UGJ6_GLOV7|nr:hypothetical protein [Gloeothece verrucosa]ADN13205.1 hypothetical protein Cyan7822_1200 [Gloeothece verrucosa PCC 7822]